MNDVHGIGLVIVTFSGLLLVDQVHTLWRALRSARWPHTTGRVIASSLAPVSLTDRSLRDVQPFVRYRYSVGETEYHGQTLSIGEGWWSFRKTRFPIQDQFPVGSRVSVFYNPLKPTDSALLVGAETSTYLRPAAAAMILIAGLKLLLL